jgi:IPT/TIG domain
MPATRRGDLIMLRTACAPTAIAIALTISATIAIGACGDPPADPAPAATITVDGVAPGHGRLPGGTTIVIGGSGFVPGPGGAPPVVVIGQRKAAAVTIVDAYTLLATTPAGDQAGDVDVLVAQPGGFARLDRGYAYDPPPQITAITPPRGDVAGGTAITIDGAGFLALDAGDATVRVGDAAATDVTVVSDTRITATTPAGTGFAHAPVTVANQRGKSAATSFYYTARGLIVAGGVNGPQNNLYYVDPVSGLTSYMFTVVESSVAISGLHSLAMDPDGTLWGTTVDGIPQLIHVDLEHQTADDLGDVAYFDGSQVNQIYCDDLEVIAGTLYCSYAARLYTIDRSTARATPVGDAGGRSFDLARVGDASYGLLSCCYNQLAPIDLATGTFGAPVDLRMGGSPLQIANGNAAGFDGAVMFVATYFWGPEGAPRGHAPGAGPPPGVFGSQIYRVDVATGDTTLVANLPLQTFALTAVE